MVRLTDSAYQLSLACREYAPRTPTGKGRPVGRGAHSSLTQLGVHMGIVLILAITDKFRERPD